MPLLLAWGHIGIEKARVVNGYNEDEDPSDSAHDK